MEGTKRWLNSRNSLIGAFFLGGAAALFFGWNWLVAAGLASIIVGVLPCLAMCALGICASRMGKKDAPAASAPQLTPQTPPQVQEQEAKRAAG